MNVFELRDAVVHDYEQYVRSFQAIRGPDISRFVDERLSEGRLWPPSLVQLNPSFAPGGSIPDLVQEGLLHPDAASVFRAGKRQTITEGLPLRLHRHQEEAVRIARTGRSYVLTTGTGSGKSLAYFIPIVDHILRHGSGQGTKAIVVYPMNALCNSQEEELTRFLRNGYPDGRGPVTFARYTGQETTEQRREIAERQPDILLTNYVMLELLLTRANAEDQRVLQNAEGLEFLVLDELHTYRGRQGADVAMLVRRVRERIGAPGIRFVGTSATIAGAGKDRTERARSVAAVAEALFGEPFTVDQVIGETLQPAIDRSAPHTAELRTRLLEPPTYPDDATALGTDPVAAWIERTFGITTERDGNVIRQTPISLVDAATLLFEATDVDEATCAAHLKAALMAGYEARRPGSDRRLFAFRLHQFVSRGDTVYSSLEPEGVRSLTLDEQQFVPGSGQRKRLFPLAFCRECGEAYAMVDLHRDEGVLVARRLRDVAPRHDEGRTSGFVHFDPAGTWAERPLDERFPEDWLEESSRGELRVKSARRKEAPRSVHVSPRGDITELDEPGRMHGWFLPAPFRFCLHCGVSYRGRQGDFGKLAELATEGRSTATTVLAVSVVRLLRGAAGAGLDDSARKLLSFTDNRQDASLQAGHLNDFVQVATLRGALARAVRAAGPRGLDHKEIADRVTDALALEPREFMIPAPESDGTVAEPSVRALRRSREALVPVVGYLLYQDLRRGWRVTAPNLEQTGLLRVDYDELDEVCADEGLWARRHPILAGATVQERLYAARVTLDFFRRELAIRTPALDRKQQSATVQDSQLLLVDPWRIEDAETMESGRLIGVGKRDGRVRGDEERGVTGRTALGQFLRRASTWRSAGLDKAIPVDEFEPLARDLFAVLTAEQYLVSETTSRHTKDPLYQLQAACLRWVEGDGRIPDHDPLRIGRVSTETREANPFFQELYGAVASAMSGIEAREHTAQVPAEIRQRREREFRAGTLPVLFCSPTMELGVDISDLNVVNLRNVPPTPANYAQRSGRAGRSGQPALVLTYCSSMSPHDQYYFQRQGAMVAGQVQPPRIDLANEELIRAHMHAVWLAETGVNLGTSLKRVLDVERRDHGLPLLDQVRLQIEDPGANRRALHRCDRILTAMEPVIAGQGWYGPDWLRRVIDGAPGQLDHAADRWRRLYLSAFQQQEIQNRARNDHSTDAQAQRAADRLRREAETQLDLLTDEHGRVDSDFYSYRYFASEGFLPGYNFPRLPLSAYLPARRPGGRDRDEFVSRGRFVAISEFGPGNSIYYEGGRYRIDRVILPPTDNEDGSRTQLGKLCPRCGYAHIRSEAEHDLCVHCGAPLRGDGVFFPNLFWLQNVTTRRVDRITSDEEERQRQGYQIQSAFSFGQTSEGHVRRSATLTAGGQRLATLLYAPTATLWRLNLGWNRRSDKGQLGFLLDTTTGAWAAEPRRGPTDEPDDDGAPAPVAARTERVVPFVEDTRNALLIELDPAFRREQEDALRDPADREQRVEPGSRFMVSLQYALKRGIELAFQLEDAELAVDLLPSVENPRAILLYEAAEGGAGVLSRLVDEPDALRAAAAAALDLLHFGEDGLDRGGPVGPDGRRTGEDCEVACYSCLMSYTNQRHHRMLFRQAVKPALMFLSEATALPDARDGTREEHRDRLLAWCGSELERHFIHSLYERGHRLPDDAQVALGELGARPDFSYRIDGERVAVFVDGPHHDDAEIRRRDHKVVQRLEDAGWTVVRVGTDETWPGVVAAHAWVFGKGNGL